MRVTDANLRILAADYDVTEKTKLRWPANEALEVLEVLIGLFFLFSSVDDGA